MGFGPIAEPHFIFLWGWGGPMRLEEVGMSLADTVTVETAGLTSSRTGLEQRRLRSGRHSVAVAFVADMIATTTAALIVTTWFVSDVSASASRVAKTGVTGAILIP